MAIQQKDKRSLPETEEEEQGEEHSEGEPEGSELLATRTESSEEPSEQDQEETDAKDEEEGEQEEDQAAAQLGMDRYVLAGFFAAAMIGAYILGRAIHGFWSNFSNQDWFSQNVPRLAAVGDDEKQSISFVIGGLIAFILVFRAYRKPDVRTWCDEVAAELTKVTWPTRKEVQSSTVIVIVASAAATLYLALLDRLWAFVTNIVYGDGS